MTRMTEEAWQKYPLLTTMNKLRKARFNAAERLAKRYRWSSVSLVVFSVYVLAISVLPKYFPIETGRVDALGFISLISSVFVIVLSLYAAFSEDALRARYLHDNAKAVTQIYQQYRAEITEHELLGKKQPDTLDFEGQYRRVMEACNYNHDQLDYHSIRAEIEKVNRSEKAWIQFRLFVNIYLWPLIAIVAPPVGMLATLLLPGLAIT